MWSSSLDYYYLIINGSDEAQASIFEGQASFFFIFISNDEPRSSNFEARPSIIITSLLFVMMRLEHPLL